MDLWPPLIAWLNAKAPGLVEQLASPWMLPQLFLLPIIYWLARRYAGRAQKAVGGWLDGYKLPSRWRELANVPLGQSKWALFALATWLITWVLRASFHPSRSYLLFLAASFATAWLTIRIVSQVIRNRTLSRAFAAIAWSITALHILGVLNDAQAMMDGVAVNFGTLRISVLSLIKGAIVLALTLWVAAALSTFSEKRIKSSLDLTPTVEVLFGKIIKAVLIAAAVAISLTSIGIDLTALTVFSGAVGLGLGFGLQKLASNLVSGVIILLDKSVKPGDVIQRGDDFGWITGLKARYVSVANRDGVEYLIPNEEFITSQVVNWSYSDTQVRIGVKFAVKRKADEAAEPQAVAAVAIAALAGIPRVLTDTPVECHLTAIRADELEFSLKFWIADPVNGTTNVRSLVMLAVWDAMKARGIEMAMAAPQ